MKVTCTEHITGNKHYFLQIAIHRRAAHPTEVTGMRTVACGSTDGEEKPHPTDAEHEDEDLNDMGAY